MKKRLKLILIVGGIAVVLGVLAVALLPALQPARESASRWAKERARSGRSWECPPEEREDESPLYPSTWGGDVSVLCVECEVMGEGEASPVPLALPGEELWVIARPFVEAPAGEEEGPGSGALVATLPDEEKEVPVPLKHTDVTASISGYVAMTEVTQQFHNPFSSKIEAKYVFPLPQNAAINEFVMTVGDRKIRGIIREREEAERIYKEARSQGYVASLLTQERANVFTQSVANIEPGKQIDINIRYYHTLAYDDGWYQYVFPMVVGPRFNPPGYTDGVGAVARGAHGISGQTTEVQYLKPGERSGHDIALRVDIDAGVPIEEIKSVNHVVQNQHGTPGKATIALSELDAIPNKDFVLRFKVAGERVKSNLLVHRDDRGGYFTLMLYPPASLNQLARKPMEMVFVIDCSGSMSGEPIAQAKAAVERALRHLEANDTFQIIRFSNNASQLGPAPVLATPDSVRTGLEYLETLHGSGGTMMIEGIKAALDFPHDPKRLRFVTFLTDGYIGNDREIIGEVQKRLGASRIFSFGVGSSTNRYLLNRMASLGQGAVAYLSLNDSAADVMDRFFERVSHPAMTDIAVDWGAMGAHDVYPSRIPDLFVGRPVILTGRFTGAGEAAVRIRANIEGEWRERTLAVNLDDPEAKHSGLAVVWARMKTAELSNRATYENNPDLFEQIKTVALDYGLMSAFTAFVAVDSLTQTAGEYGTTVSVPVNVPDGVRYDTTVQE